jgi:hypothetical protein
MMEMEKFGNIEGLKSFFGGTFFPTQRSGVTIKNQISKVKIKEVYFTEIIISAKRV